MKAPRILSATLPLILILCFCPISRADDLFVFVRSGGGGDSAEYQNVLCVAKNGAPFTSIQAALDSITDAAEDNRYLVVVSPGTYQEQVQLKEWVDVRGASRQATKITTAGGSAPTTATVLGADHSGISNLTIESTGDGLVSSVAVFNNGVSPRLYRLDIIVQGSEVDNEAGVWNSNNASPEISDLSIRISGNGDGSSSFGIRSEDYSSPRIRNTTIAVSSASGGSLLYGVYNYSHNESEMHNLDIVITGTSAGTSAEGIHNELSSGVMTQCRITLNEGGDEVYGVNNQSSPTSLTDSKINISTTAGEYCYGVRNSSSDGAVLRNVNIYLDAADYYYVAGVFNNQCSPILSKLNLETRGRSSNSMGVFNDYASPVIEYCSIQVGPPSGSWSMGIYNMHTSRPTISFCHARGGLYGMQSSSGSASSDSLVAVKSHFQGWDCPVHCEPIFDVHLTSCILESGVIISGELNCTDCYDESGNVVNCP